MCIRDSLLRAWITLRGYPPHRPSEMMAQYIYDDIMSDMTAMGDDYKSNFMAEVVNVYSEKEDADSTLTEEEIMRAMVWEQYQIVYPAIMKNLAGKDGLVCSNNGGSVTINSMSDFVYHMFMNYIMYYWSFICFLDDKFCKVE